MTMLNILEILVVNISVLKLVYTELICKAFVLLSPEWVKQYYQIAQFIIHNKFRIELNKISEHVNKLPCSWCRY